VSGGRYNEHDHGNQAKRDAVELAEFRPYRAEAPEFVYDRLYGPLDSLFEFDKPGPTITIFRLVR